MSEHVDAAPAAGRLPRRRAGPSTAIAVATLAAVSACVSYPEPDVHAARLDDTALAPGERVALLSASQTRAQSEFVACVHRTLRAAAPDLEIMRGASFRDALYPWFEPAAAPETVDELTVLLARPAVERRIENLGVHFVAVVEGGTREENAGFFFCGGAYAGAGCLGFASEERVSTITAAVWDLKKGVSAGQATAKATGTNVSIGVIVPILFFSRTESAACDGLGRQLARFLSGGSPVSTQTGGAAPSATAPSSTGTPR